MIDFKLRVVNPWSKDKFNAITNWVRLLPANKVIEIELYKSSGILFEFTVDINWRQRDHAGPRLELGLLTFVVSAHLYDRRHWDHVLKCWEKTY